jgi:hypothetical protein
MIFMPSMDVEAYEVKTKVSDRQLEFLENRGKENMDTKITVDAHSLIWFLDADLKYNTIFHK